MTVTIDIPADRRITVPREVPVGRTVLTFTPAVAEKAPVQPLSQIEGIRQLLQKEMAENGTSAVMAASGDGWEAYVRERHAEP